MTAKYLQIAREIKKRIISQQYPASAPLPDQFALAAEFSTSRMTIQQAMRQLIVEGLIYTRKGRSAWACAFPAIRSKVRCLSTPMPRCMTLFACGCSTASRYRWI